MSNTASLPAIKFQQLLNSKSANIKEIGKFLDGLSGKERIEVIRCCNKQDQIKLWDLAEGAKKITIDHFIPKDKENKAVHHLGKNSLGIQPLSLFEKRFIRSKVNENELWGYNYLYNSILSYVAGAGYFKARDDVEAGEVIFDYYVYPEEQTQGWPKLKERKCPLQKAIYGNMIDVARGISDDVIIGKVYKNNKASGDYFLLAREA